MLFYELSYFIETPVVPVSDKVESEHELSPTINEPKEFEGNSSKNE
jgi:hypothetical protein